MRFYLFILAHVGLLALVEDMWRTGGDQTATVFWIGVAIYLVIMQAKICHLLEFIKGCWR